MEVRDIGCQNLKVLKWNHIIAYKHMIFLASDFLNFEFWFFPAKVNYFSAHHVLTFKGQYVLSWQVALNLSHQEFLKILKRKPPGIRPLNLKKIPVSHWLIFCCRNLIPCPKKREMKLIKTQIMGWKTTKNKNTEKAYVNIN